MKTRWFTAAASVVLLSAGAGIAAPVSATPTGGDAASVSGVDKTRALVQLAGDPITTSSKTKPAQGKKIDWAGQNVRSYRAELSARRNEFKRWLRVNAPKARVTGEFDVTLNAVSLELNGTSLEVLRTSPLAVQVEYQGLYSPTIGDPDLSIISAQAAWSSVGGGANAGSGIKVGVVDAGIDQGHSCFTDSGYLPQPQLGDTTFTNNKVIVARVFYNKAKSMQLTPEAIGDHGTHVAGTIACNYQTEATVDGVTIPYLMSGVAPKAMLGNYNVFPGEVESARSEDILNALDAAVVDGMDVINMSLGGGSHGIQDLLTKAVDNIDRAGIVVAVSAGNEGPGYDTVGSPGMAARALSAGASTVPHFVGATLTVDPGSTYAIASGDFAVVPDPLKAPLAVVLGGVAATGTLNTACAPLAAKSLTGKIAVISRGTCSFSAKVLNAQTAGAVAAIVVNNVAGDPTAMGTDGTPNQPTIPAYMVSLSARAPLVATAAGATGTISSTLAYQLTGSVDIMAGFSSQGPTDVDRRVKPDVVAPGVNVLSSIPRSYCGGANCFAFFSGTSMASPHLAGSAAVVFQKHPLWSAAQVRSAIVNTANDDVLKGYETGIAPVTDPNIVGSGREDLAAAVNATVLLDPVSVSFGRIPSGSGQTRSATITVTNTTGGGLTATIDGPGASKFTTSVVPAGATVTITVTGTSAKGQAAGKVWATLRIAAGDSEVAHAVLFYEVG